MFVISNAITLILVMDPFGNIPAFLALLSHMEPKRRRRVIMRELLIALAILILFLFFGGYILKGMHISEPALSIAGGIILFLIALKMIFPETVRGGQTGETDDDPLIVPLAVPLVAGPSTIVMVTLMATQSPDRSLESLTALLIAWLTTALILLLSDALRIVLGTRILKAIERLMGMILTTMAVQMLLSGVATYLTALGIA